MPDGGGEIGFGLTSVEDGDRVPEVQQALHDVWTGKVGSSQDQDAHGTASSVLNVSHITKR